MEVMEAIEVSGIGHLHHPYQLHHLHLDSGRLSSAGRVLSFEGESARPVLKGGLVKLLAC